jgi:hypothetical protein
MEKVIRLGASRGHIIITYHERIEPQQNAEGLHEREASISEAVIYTTDYHTGKTVCVTLTTSDIIQFTREVGAILSEEMPPITEDEFIAGL